jgi:high-affinity iron transporter
VKARIGAMAALLAIGAAAAGCGSGDSSSDSEAAEHQATPQQAVAEIAAVRSGLTEALATYKSGDRAAADEQVGTAYLEHFELVEGPLEEVDHELTEELEDGIREHLREAMRDDASVARVRGMIEQLDAQLAEAKVALQQ